MQPIYRKRRARTTAELLRRPEGILRGIVSRCLLVALGAAVASSPSISSAQTAAIGMVEQPCPPPLEALPEPPTEAGIVARRQALAERRRTDWGGLCRHRAANAAVRDAPVQAVFIGDSITEFWEAAAPNLFRDGVLNRGIGAQTSPQMLLRFYQDVIALRPRAVHIMAGTNDVAGNTGPSRPEDFRNNIRAMVDLAQAHDIAVVIGSIPPSASFDWRPELRPAARIRELNAWLEAFARERGLLFVDYHAAMTGPSGELRPEFTSDGVHPDARGYAVMTPMAGEAIARARDEQPVE